MRIPTYVHHPPSMRMDAPPPRSVDPGLAQELGAPLSEAVSFFDDATANAAPLVIDALRAATGCGDYSVAEARFAYR